MIKQFATDKLVLNLDDTNIMKFITNNTSHSTLYIGYKVKYIEETVNTKFFCLQIDSHINWRNHIEQMIPQLSAVHYAVRSTVHISNINTLKSIYYCIMSIWYKIWNIFWGCSNSGNIFTVQKKIVRIMAGAQLFLNNYRLEILPVPFEYIFSLMNCTVNNHENLQTNSPIYNINRRNMHDLHRPNANLSCCQKSTFYVSWNQNFQQLTTHSWQSIGMER